MSIELASHADVLEVSVVARSHPKWGERPMAFVILKADAVERWTGKYKEFEDDLKRHARKRLPGFACPEWVNVVEELPVSILFHFVDRVLSNAFSLRKLRRGRFRRCSYGKLWPNYNNPFASCISLYFTE